MIAHYTFEEGSGTTVANQVGSAYSGTLVAPASWETSSPLAGSASLSVSSSDASRMTIDGGESMIKGWAGIDVEARVQLPDVAGQHTLFHVAVGGGNGSQARFRFTVRDGKLFAGLRFVDVLSGSFMSYYNGNSSGVAVIDANTAYDIGVTVDAVAETVDFRYKLATTSDWTVVGGFTSSAHAWASAWPNTDSWGAAVGGHTQSGEWFGGLIDNVKVTMIPVPEPTSLSLLGLGALTLLRRRRA